MYGQFVYKISENVKQQNLVMVIMIYCEATASSVCILLYTICVHWVNCISVWYV